MKKKANSRSVAFLVTGGLAAVGIGVVLAFLGGYFLGHFTGHDKTTTVSLASSQPESAGGESSGEEMAEAPPPVETAPEEEAPAPKKEAPAPKEEAPAPQEGGTSQGEKGEPSGGGDPQAGSEVFAQNCSVCHGADGHGGAGGPDLRTMPLAKTEAGAIQQVTNGGGGMPPFGGSLSEQEIKDVAAYVVQEIVG